MGSYIHNVSENRTIRLYRGSDSTKNFNNFFGMSSSPGGSNSLRNIFQNIGTAVDIPNSIVLMMKEDTITFPIDNEYKNVLEGVVDKFLGGTAGMLAKFGSLSDVEASGSAVSAVNPWYKYVKAWSNTKPISFDLKFDFKLGQFGLWSAKEEVVRPIASLMIPSLPESIKGSAMKGPFMNAQTLIFSSLLNWDIGDLSGSTGLFNTVTKFGDVISQIIWDSVKSNTYTIEVGSQMVLNSCVCTKASYSFNTEVDEDGYPISGSVSLTMEGILPPAMSVDIGNGSSAKAYAFRFQNLGRRA